MGSENKLRRQKKDPWSFGESVCKGTRLERRRGKVLACTVVRRTPWGRRGWRKVSAYKRERERESRPGNFLFSSWDGRKNKGREEKGKEEGEKERKE